MSDFAVYLPISKIDEEKRMVWGYASTPTKDLQGEIVKVSAIKGALADYMEWANIREMHRPSAVGVTVEHTISEKGLYIGAKIVDEAAWQKCKPITPGGTDAVYKGFSIGGNTLEKIGDTITQIQLIEISLVDRPANPTCKIDMVKGMAEVKLAGADTDEPSRNTLIEKFLDMGARLLGMEPTKKSVVFNESVADDRYEGISSLEVEKREFKEKERSHLASTGAALPDGSFPIENTSDLHNAIQAHGRAKDKEKAKAHIIARAHAIGASHMLPEGWGKLATSDSEFHEENYMKLADAQALAKKYNVTVEEVAKRLSKNRHEHMEKAAFHLKKAQALHAKCMKCVGKSLTDGSLVKALIASGIEKGEAENLTSHLHKMSDEHDMVEHHMGKAAGGHVSQGGMSAIDSSYDDSGDVKHKTQSELTEGEVDELSMFGVDSPYSEAERHKGAQVDQKQMTELVTKAITEALKPMEKQVQDLRVENAELKGRASALALMPGQGRRAQLFAPQPKNAGAFLLGDGSEDVNSEISKAWDSIDPNDPDSATRAAAHIIGVRTLANNGRTFGKSLFDPEFKGAAGNRRH